MEHSESVAESRVYWICDICGRRSNTRAWSAMVYCDGCGCDICSDCQRYSPREYYCDSGDYSILACSDCVDLFQKSEFGIQMSFIEERREETYRDEEKLWEKWKRECSENHGGCVTKKNE